MVKLNETPLVKEIVYDKLRAQILSLRSHTRVRIPSERDLSDKLGVSRLSIRTALKKLSEEGLLEQVQGKGTYITPHARISSLGLICSPDIKSTDPFFNHFLAEIAAETARRFINLVMVDSSNPLSGQNGTPAVIIGLLQNNVLKSVLSTFSPVITVQEYPWHADISQISFDDYKIGCDAARILAEHNHTHILHLAGPEKYPSAFFRKKGFQDAAEKLGIYSETVTDKMNWAGGYNQGALFVRKFSASDRPTAVFAANDWMAAGFMKYLQENGLRIPGDVSILGCDNIPLSNEYTPALSTFDLNMQLLVRELFMMMELSMQNPSYHTASVPKTPESKRVLLPATPIIRESIRTI